jgi:hypothetical protein
MTYLTKSRTWVILEQAGKFNLKLEDIKMSFFEGCGVPTELTKAQEAKNAGVRGKSSGNAAIEGTSGSFAKPSENKGV